MCFIGTLFLFLLPLQEHPCDVDLDLRLDLIPSIQISSAYAAPTRLGLSPDELIEPFKTRLSGHGLKIDQKNDANVLSTHVWVTSANVGGTTVYFVSIESRYEEACLSKRLGLDVRCALWETGNQVKTFTDLESVSKSVRDVVSSNAKEFLEASGLKRPRR